MSRRGLWTPLNQVWLTCGAPATAAQCQAINGLLPRFFGQIPRTAKNDLYFGRLDYHLNDKNTFSASFNYLTLALAQWHSNRPLLHIRLRNHRKRRR